MRGARTSVVFQLLDLVIYAKYSKDVLAPLRKKKKIVDLVARTWNPHARNDQIFVRSSKIKKKYGGVFEIRSPEKVRSVFKERNVG